MKYFFTLLTFFSFFTAYKAKAQVNFQDSSALVDLYKKSGGTSWINHNGWLAGPIKNWFGVGVTWIYDNDGNIIGGNVSSISLPNNNLTGTLQSSIGNISQLSYLLLSSNTLTGSVPFAIGNLFKLQFFNINGNQFTGAIPYFGSLSNLTYLDLGNNQLSGSIPDEIGYISKLTDLNLSSNKLTGSIPSSLGSLSLLKQLSLQNNQLTGSIPSELGLLYNLNYMAIGNNPLTGNIPSSFGSLFNLTYLYIANAQIGGSIPSQLGFLSNLTGLELQVNQLTGSIPANINNLTKLKLLNLNNNQLSSPIPQSIGDFPLTTVNISNNKFVFDKGMEKIAAKSFAIYSPQDSIPINVQNIGIGAYKFSASAYFSMPFGFDLGDYIFGHVKFNWWQNGLHDLDHGLNNIDSTYIPGSQNSSLAYTYWSVVTDSLCPKLTLYSKHYTTTPVFINLPFNDSLYLTRFYTTTNGSAWTNKTNWLAPGKPISTWFGITVNSSSRVTSINLPNNNLTGTIPDVDSIGTLTNLQTLNLPNNIITGSLPATLGNLANLQTLNFGSNKLSGSIPTSFGNLANLTSLTLNFNSLSGSIPSSLGNLSKLTVLDMWVNQFSGSIPAEIGNLTNLTTVWLNWNQLSGSIPTSFGNLTKLKELHLDNNLLSGTLPTQFTNFTQLTGLTLGTNQFTFDGLEAIVQKYTFTTYTPQATIPITNAANLLTVAAGGTLSKNTYKWFKNGTLVATNTGNASYVATTSGSYYAIVNNTVATALTLTSATTAVTIAPPVTNNDSLVLVKLYNSTNGINWTKKTNWLVAGKAISTWYGIITNTAGRVTDINLSYNNLTGTVPDADSLGTLIALQTITLGGGNVITGNLPSGLGNLINLTSLVLDGNAWSGTIPASYGNLINLQLFSISGQGKSQLTGSIPSTLGNLTNLQELWLDGNNLNGSLPASLTSFTKLDGAAFKLESNSLTFDGLEAIVKRYSFATYSPQANISITNNSNKLSVTAGGTLANNTYKWYQNGILVDSVKGDSTYMPNSNGNYSAQVTNSIATKLVLYSNILAVNTVNFVLATANTSSTEAINGQTLFYNGISIINTIAPSGASPVTGNITAKVTIDASVQSVNGQPYLQRHYDIEPATNASTATATVTLYYTQAEFTAYNTAAAVAGLPLLPIDATDADNNKTNLKVIQFHGTGTAPGNYSGYTGVGATNLLITPNTVSYNNNAARWEVTFPVTGFSGFYISTGGNTLPITLLSFTAILQNKQSMLNWITATETNNKGFDMERSANAQTFTKIGYITGHGTTTQQKNYNYTDAQPLQGKNYYRLKQTDFDGHFAYSNIVEVNNAGDNNSLKIFPSPAKNNITISTTGYSGIVQILDMDGRIIKTTTISGNNTILDITDLPTGNYFCRAGLTTTLFIKQ